MGNKKTFSWWNKARNKRHKKTQRSAQARFIPIVKGAGFTLIELTIVIAITAILVLISIPVYKEYRGSIDLDLETQKIINVLRKAQSDSISSEGGNKFGVRFETGRYTYFEGNDWDTRTQASDKISTVAPDIEIYEISFAESPSSDVVFNKLNGTTPKYGSLKVRIKNSNESRTVSVNPQGLIGEYSLTSQPAPPTSFSLLGPAKGSTRTVVNPTLTWEASTDPDGGNISYTLWHSTDPTFTTKTEITDIATTSYSSQTFTNYTNNYWKIIAVDDESNQTFSNETDWYVNVQASQPPGNFNLLSPASGTTTTTTLAPAFNWEDSADPDNDNVTYQIQIDVQPANWGGGDLIQVSNLDRSEFTANPDTQPGAVLVNHRTYDWRVRATDGGNWVTSNQTWTITTNLNNSPSTFDMKSPVDEQILDTETPTFTLQTTTDPDAGAGDTYTYTLEFDDNVDFSSPEQIVTDIPPNPNPALDTVYTLQPGEEVADQTTHYWKAKAVDNHGAQIYGSAAGLGTADCSLVEICSFTVNANAAPGSFDLTYPVNGGKVPFTLPTLMWNQAIDPDGDPLTYTLYLSANSNFPVGPETDQISVGTDVGSYRLEDAYELADDGTYYWKMSVTDGEEVTWSNQTNWLFGVNASPWFTDDMESGTAKWVAGGTWQQVTNEQNSGTTSWRIQASANSLTTVSNMDITGAVNPRLTFWQRFSGTGYADFSTDGGSTWGNTTTAISGQNNAWTYRWLDVPDGVLSGDLTTVKFRFRTANTSTNWWVDDVILEETPYPTYTSLQYDDDFETNTMNANGYEDAEWIYEDKWARSSESTLSKINATTGVASSPGSAPNLTPVNYSIIMKDNIATAGLSSLQFTDWKKSWPQVGCSGNNAVTYLDYSYNDGFTWTNAATIEGNNRNESWTYHKYDASSLLAGGSMIKFKIRLYAVHGGGCGAVDWYDRWVDNIRIETIPDPTYTSLPFTDDIETSTMDANGHEDANWIYEDKWARSAENIVGKVNGTTALSDSPGAGSTTNGVSSMIMKNNILTAGVSSLQFIDWTRFKMSQGCSGNNSLTYLDYSYDDGFSWTNATSLVTNWSNLAWTQQKYDASSLLAGGSKIKFRIRFYNYLGGGCGGQSSADRWVDNIRFETIPDPTYTSLPFTDDIETSTMNANGHEDDNWIYEDKWTRSSENILTKINSTTALADSPGVAASDGFSSMIMKNNITTAGLSSLQFSYWIRYLTSNGTYANSYTRIDHSYDDGFTWTSGTTSIGNSTNRTWTYYKYDVSSLLAGGAKIKFRISYFITEGYGGTPTGGRWMDNIRFETIPNPTYNSLPFVDDIETNTMDANGREDASWIYEDKWGRSSENTLAKINGTTALSDSPGSTMNAGWSSMIMKNNVATAGLPSLQFSLWNRYYPVYGNPAYENSATYLDYSYNDGFTWTQATQLIGNWRSDAWIYMKYNATSLLAGGDKIKFRLRFSHWAYDWYNANAQRYMDNIRIETIPSPTLVSLPYADDFETSVMDPTGYQDEDWIYEDRLSASTAQAKASITGTTTAGAGQGGFIANGSPRLIMRKNVDLSTPPASMQISFWSAFGNTGAMYLEYSTDDGFTWTNFATIYSSQNKAWVYNKYDISSLISGNSKIKFRFNFAVVDTAFAVIDNVRIETIPDPTYTSLPFTDSFEAGTDNWILEHAWNRHSTTAWDGTYSMSKDENPPLGYGGDQEYDSIIMKDNIDLTGITELEVSYWLRHADNSTNSNTAIDASFDDGFTWQRLYWNNQNESWGYQARAWMHRKWDLTPYIADKTQVKIRIYNVCRGCYGYLVDDFEIQEKPAFQTVSLPFYDNAESETGVWEYEQNWSQNTQDKHIGSKSYRHDVTTGYDVASMTMVKDIDVSGINTELRFWYRSYNYGNITVDVSADHGYTWTLGVFYTSQINAWTYKKLDLTPYYNGDYLRIRFRNWVNDPDGFIDDIRIQETPVPVVQDLPFTEDFESGMTHWDTQDSGMDLSTDNPHGGSNSLTDSPDGNYQVGYTYLAETIDSFNLVSSVDAPEMTFWQRYKYPANSRGYVDVSVNNGVTWDTAYSVPYGQDTSWRQIKVDLAPYIGYNIKIRFRFAAVACSGVWCNSYAPDGWNIDDIYIGTRTNYLDDFEDNNLNSPVTTMGWADDGGGAYTLTNATASQSKYGLHSMKVAYDKTGNANAYFRGSIDPANSKKNFSGSKYFAMDVKGVADIEVQLNSGGGNATIGTASVNSPGGFQKIAIDYSDNLASFDENNVTSADIFFYKGSEAESGSVYIDNVRLDEDFVPDTYVDNFDTVTADNCTYPSVEDGSTTNTNHGYLVSTSNEPRRIDAGKLGRGLEFNGDDWNLVGLGNSASLSIAGDMSISVWVKPDNFTRNQTIYYKGYASEGAMILLTSGVPRYYYGNQAIGTGTNYYLDMNVSIPAGEWTHLVLVRDFTSGKVQWYKNGSFTNETPTAIGSSVASTVDAWIGAGNWEEYWGQMDEFSLWNTALDAPTISNMWNGGAGAELVGDEAGLASVWHMNDADYPYALYSDSSSYGYDAQIRCHSEPQAGKWGNGAKLDGVNDNFVVRDNDDIDLNISDFTLETWIKTTNATGKIMNKYDTRSPNAGWSWQLSAGKMTFWSSAKGSWVTGVGTVNNNEWHHIAMTMSSGTVKFWIDGNLDSTLASATPPAASTKDLAIGIRQDTWWGTEPLNALIDDMRISNNLRYTSNFTPHSSPHVDDANTLLLLHFNEDISTVWATKNSAPPTYTTGDGILKWHQRYASWQYAVNESTQSFRDFDYTIDTKVVYSNWNNNTQGLIGTVFRASMSDTNIQQGLIATRYSGTVSLGYITSDGGWTTLTSKAGQPLNTIGTMYRQRVQARGYTIKYKIWDASGAEPDAWDLSATTNWAPAGNIGVTGVYANYEFSNINLAQLDPAPDEDVSDTVIINDDFGDGDVSDWSIGNIGTATNNSFTTDAHLITDSSSTGYGLRLWPEQMATQFTDDGKFNGGLDCAYEGAPLSNWGPLFNRYTTRLSGAHTVEFWIKPQSAGVAGNRFIIGRSETTLQANYVVFLYDGTNKIMGGYRSTTGTWENLVGNTDLTPGQWYHVAYVFDGSMQKIYVNGVEDGSRTPGVLTPLWNNGSGIAICGYQSNYAYNSPDAILDDIRISNNARYTGSFTPPTSMLTPDINTVTLWNMEDKNDVMYNQVANNWSYMWKTSAGMLTDYEQTVESGSIWYGTTAEIRGVAVRMQSNGNGYTIGTWDGVTYLHKWVGGVATVIHSIGGQEEFVYGQNIIQKVQVEGSTFRYKYWHKGRTEPEEWLELRDPNGTYTSGYPGIANYQSYDYWDNFFVTELPD